MAATTEGFLVSTQWLADRLDGADRDFVLIDAGEAVAYRRAHLPGAVGLPHPYLKGADDPKLVMSPAEFEALAGRLGVSNETPVIVYDDNASLHAARVWWVFGYYGHHDVRVVDGGLNAWLDEGRPLTSEVPHPDPASFRAQADASRVCLVDDLLGIVGSEGTTQIWDTRSDGEWEGTNDRGNARAGHVPGATHLEWISLMEGPPARRFRPLDEIRAILERAGIDPEAETVTY